MNLKDASEVFSKYYRKPEFAKSLLEDAMREEDISIFLIALREIIKANDGMAEVSEVTGLDREYLSRTLSTNGNPPYGMVNKILRSMGLRLTVAPIEAEHIEAEQVNVRATGLPTPVGTSVPTPLSADQKEEPGKPVAA